MARFSWFPGILGVLVAGAFSGLAGSGFAESRCRPDPTPPAREQMIEIAVDPAESYVLELNAGGWATYSVMSAQGHVASGIPAHSRVELGRGDDLLLTGSLVVKIQLSHFGCSLWDDETRQAVQVGVKKTHGLFKRVGRVREVVDTRYSAQEVRYFIQFVPK